jgi:hypothetical protein
MNESDLTDISPIAAFLPATIVPDIRLSDEQLEIAAELGLDQARIRCERTEKGTLRMYAPPPHQIWLMIHVLYRELLRWFAGSKATGHVAMRRRFFLGNNSVLCPDVAYIASGIDKRAERVESTTVLKLCPKFVAEFCSHPRELRGLKDKMLQWLAGGVELGWLLVPQEQCVYVYSPRAEPSIIDSPFGIGVGTWGEFAIPLDELWRLDEYRRHS